jgi:hypothetical protein
MLVLKEAVLDLARRNDQSAPHEAEATSRLEDELTEALIRYFESRTAPEQKMESTAVFVLAKLLAAIVSDRDDIEEIAQTVYDRILRIE